MCSFLTGFLAPVWRNHVHMDRGVFVCSADGRKALLCVKKNMMTLQAAGFCAHPDGREGNGTRPKKSIPPFASRYPASLTVEAAVCLPLFLFFAAALMQPMVWLDRQRKVQTAAEAVGEELSTAVYLAKLAEKEDIELGEEELQVVSDTAAGLLLQGKAGAYADELTVKEADVGGEDGLICLEASWPEPIPFFDVGTGVTMYAGVKRRAWIGLAGKLGEEEDDSGDTGTTGTMVYVGAGMGRYHLYRDCHYISNDYRTIPAADAAKQKNSAGRYYTPCSRCAGKGTAGTEAYVTPGGEHYHLDPDCSAMVSYVRKVPLEEVEQLGLCSYCRKRGAGG